MALNVVRKHRLWEAFLFKTFDMSLHDIHREAELLEHQTSDFLAEQINSYLGHPKFDPHGDPIPNSDGEITTKNTSVSLSKTEEGKSYVISRLMSDDKEFFEFCALNGLKNGNTVLVSKQFSKNKMTQITINNSTILLNEDLQILFMSIKSINKSLLIAILFAVSLTAFAQDTAIDSPLVTDRPDATEASSTVGKGVFQIETGGFYESYKDGNETFELNTYNTTLLRYGILDNLEIRVGWNLLKALPRSETIGLMMLLADSLQC